MLILFVSFVFFNALHGLRLPRETPLDFHTLSEAEELLFVPATFEGKLLGNATAYGKKCSSFNLGKPSYTPSALEASFKNDVLGMTGTVQKNCAELKPHAQPWLDQIAGRSPMETEGQLFSQMCKSGSAEVQLIEPLAGILRDPRVFCQGTWKKRVGKMNSILMSVNWISLADKSLLEGGKNILFDAGGTRFIDAMAYFTHAYEQRGIVFDEIHVWEASKQGEENYWRGVPQEVQKKWRPKLHFYDGVPVQATKGHKDNVVERILRDCNPQDFCAFKLDIDTPKVEYSLVMQLLEHAEETSAKLDEFFFEHHVNGLMARIWGSVDMTFVESYDLFTQLRELGVRAHSWI